MNERLTLQQRRAVDVILSRISDGQKRIYLAMPAGTGKTTILLHAVSEYYKIQKSKFPRILIVYHNRDSVQYALSFFQKNVENKHICTWCS
ncbi:MAG: hypothetical protein EOP48_22560 [Sphingobacteriales bacterium]|nr:MAG: hypothetical protein EOP48_22560 [Sphingobacteriales bacterium]